MKTKKVLFVGVDFSCIPVKDRKEFVRKTEKNLKHNVRNKKCNICVYDTAYTGASDIFLMEV